MALSSLIDSQLNFAFRQLQDLAVDVTFTRKNSSDFDFESGEATVDEDTVTTKAVFTDVEKKSKSSRTIKKLVMLKRKEIGETSLYDTLNDGTNVWTVGTPIKDNGYITIIEVYREA